MSVDSEIPWDLVAQVRRSRPKSEIVNELAAEPLAATELADKLNVQTGSASNYLRELKKMEPPVVECITPEQPHHRLYALTEDGNKIVDHV